MMNMKIIPVLAAAAVAVLAAGCHHHHDNDYYRPGPSHHYNHYQNNGWHGNQNRPRPQHRPHYVTVNQAAAYPRLYQLQ